MKMEETMTPLERMAALKKGKPADRLPITLFHPAFAAKISGMSYNESHRTAEKIAQREIKMYKEFGVDEVCIMYLSLKLSNTMRIENLDELEKLDPDFYSFEKDKRQQINYEAAELIYKEIGDEVPICYGISGPFTLARGLVLVEVLLKGTRKKPEKVHQLMRFITDVLKRMIDRFSNLGYLSYLIYDPVASGSLISPRQYEEFCLPYTRELIEHMKKDGSFTSLHVCGDTSGTLELFAETGVDAISLDQKVDLAFAKEKIGSRAVLMGNVDPVQEFLQGTPESVGAAVRKCYEKAGSSPIGFIIRSGCGIPHETPVENVKAYMAAARKYGSLAANR